jgi:NitT/TauT family transport system substrate-binding protein
MRGLKLLFLSAFSAAVLARLIAPSLAMAAQSPRATVKVLVPEAGNLQLLAFYVALGAGYFADAGLDVVPVSPPSPALAQGLFTNGEAPAALLPAPVYERLIEERFPLVLVANLLQNDPIELVVSRAAAEGRGLSRTRPLADRLRAMQGLRIGVGPHPRPRLATLFASQGLDLDALATVVIVPGRAQVEALANGKVDALYTHTPFLENVLVDQGAVVVVDQAGGEVPALAGRQIHALAVTRALRETQPAVVRGLVQAIGRAEALVHADAGAGAAAILRALPARDRIHVDRLVALYAPAVPRDPRLSARAILRELAFYPDGEAPPALAGLDLSAYVANDSEHRACPSRERGRAPVRTCTGASSRLTRHRAGLVVIALALASAVLALLLREGRDSSRNRLRDTSV